MKKRKQTTPLLSALTISMLCTSVAAAAGAHGTYQKYDTDGWSQPAIAVLMQGLANRDYPWSNAGSGNAVIPSANQPNPVELPVDYMEPPEATASHTGNDAAGQTDAAASGSLSDAQPGTSTSGSLSDAQPGTSTSGSLSDAQPGTSTSLLIGDSRAEGVALYSGWDNLTYYAEGGMTIYNMFQRQVAKEDGQKISVEEALQKHTFGKIYLEIGINEMGTGTLDSFMEAYENAVNHLRELQPDAILYLCGIMYVKQSKSESDPIFNNPNIQARNDRIAQLADGENIFYLDINELVTDETGNLNPDYTWDEVHLLGKYDSLWLDYFCSHGIVKEAH
ncbi:MAG: hypothetical protein HFH84_11435 [Lachnospiraceae bacterium]|nr:hypothetical protein [Lachnospiraceae bacterium]